VNAKKTKLTLVIGEGLNRRLDYQAARDGKGHDRSSIVEALVEAHISLPEAVDAILTQPAEAVASARQPSADGARSKTTFYLSPSAARRLQLHATWKGEDRSEAVERLIRDHVTPWDVYDPRKSYVSARRIGRQSEATQISPDAGESAA
jgi:hypothetical protein